MTAIVGILNRRGAVLAADSAVTVGDGARRKIYNTATKIFRLTNGPVGVMIFSSAEVNGMPWDVIFKLFRERYGKQTFPSLMDYVRNFINFLKSENCFSTEKTQMDYFESEVRRLYNRLATAINDKLPDESDPKDAEVDDVAFEEIVNDTIRDFEEHFDEVGVCSEMENYTIGQMRKYGAELFNSMAEQYDNDGFSEGFREKWEKMVFAYMRSQCFYQGTGIIFVGYGEKDIYPSLIPLYISGEFDGRIRHFMAMDDSDVISPQETAVVHPFAQSDVMHTLVDGINPSFRDVVSNLNKRTASRSKEMALEALKKAGAPKRYLEAIESMDLAALNDEFDEAVDDYSSTEFSDGVVDAVDSFNLEDMANMAESLVSVTNLHRHISSSEESVGGPIDVAVITRAEGFMWVKHKQWIPQGVPMVE
jgi:hypothetical protein